MPETMKRPRVVIVGGGAAGIVAALRAAERGAYVTLLEKNERLGMKILISGGGKCNLTHAGPMEDVRAKFRPNEARFLKPSFYRFTNENFLNLLHRRGMATYARPDGRVFPVEPSNAKDVVALLTRLVEDAGVEIRYNAPVTALAAESGKVTGVQLGDRFLSASRVVVCTGGSSYPATGTTGDGWRWLSALGHTLVPLRAALAPMYLDAVNPDWSGIALRDARLRARASREGKEFARWSGDLLFTHKGVSGPTALGVSREVAERMAEPSMPSEPVLEADLVPDIAFEQLQAQLRCEMTASPRRTAASLVAPYVPSRLVEPLLESAGIAGETRGAQLSSKALTRLVNVLKGWPLGSVRAVPLERGEVVAGGVSLDEVDFKTMQSNLIAGLYLCGEVLDIAGPVGGYNLQAAWSTGYVAGDSAANSDDPPPSPSRPAVLGLASGGGKNLYP